MYACKHGQISDSFPLPACFTFIQHIFQIFRIFGINSANAAIYLTFFLPINFVGYLQTIYAALTRKDQMFVCWHFYVLSNISFKPFDVDIIIQGSKTGNAYQKFVCYFNLTRSFFMYILCRHFGVLHFKNMLPYKDVHIYQNTNTILNGAILFPNHIFARPPRIYY